MNNMSAEKKTRDLQHAPPNDLTHCTRCKRLLVTSMRMLRHLKYMVKHPSSGIPTTTLPVVVNGVIDFELSLKTYLAVK